MQKSILLFSVVLFFVFGNILQLSSSSGAPEASTGAPGEKHCASVGCHDSYDANTGNGILKINNGNITEYVAGEKYTVEIDIKESGFLRYGFELTALDTSGKSVGEFTLKDLKRTQQFPGSGKHLNRNYITYTTDGTTPLTNGENLWQCEWTAPSSLAGKVTLYAAAVSANGDGTDKNDYTYTTNFEMNEANLSCNKFCKNLINKSEIFYDYMNEKIFLNFENNLSYDYIIFDISGKIISTEKKNSPEGNIAVQGLQAGIYFIKTISNGTENIYKFIKL